MAGEIPSVPARRFRRPRLRDPRLAVGLVLVAGAVALGSWAVADAGRGVPLYAAKGVLTPGERVTDADLVIVDARVPGATGVYLEAAAGIPADAVVTRVVGAGELVPAAAVGVAGDLDVRPVGMSVPGPLSASVVEGAVVDLWLTPPAESGRPAPSPALVAAGLVVAGVTQGEGLFAAGSATSVEVLVPGTDLEPVLAALAGEGTITLVPALGGP